MDFSWLNTSLWSPMLQLGALSALLLLSNILIRKVSFLRKSLLPTSVLAGFLLLLLRTLRVLPVDAAFLDNITYHSIALGFIAMSLCVPDKTRRTGDMAGLKSGALIVSCYVLQGLIGLAITIGLAYTVMPGFFKAAGILLPMGYGQGPGQANNVGSTYEQMGFQGGQSFGLSIAAMGFLCACVVGVIYLNVLRAKGMAKRRDASDEEDVSGSVSVEMFQSTDEVPISHSIDRMSIQVVLVLSAYLATYLVSLGLDRLIAWALPGMAASLNSLIWGFNFIVGSALAMLMRVVFVTLRKSKVMTRQYQNNYLLSRLSGLAFDFMVVAGIGSIQIEDLSGLWLPYALLCSLGAVLTLVYMQWICKKVYEGYYYEGLLSMYGMMTGTISSGVLLLRELDPKFETPASRNLVAGSGFAILFGAPMLLLIGLAPKDDVSLWLTVGLLAVYMVLLLVFLLKFKRKAT